MTPEVVEAEVERCFRSEVCDVNHLSGNFGDRSVCEKSYDSLLLLAFWRKGMPTAGLLKAAGVRPIAPLNERTKLQLQSLVLQCKFQVHSCWCPVS